MRVPEEDGEEVVRVRAYFFWKREGCADGRPNEHWRRARSEGASSEQCSDEGFTRDEEAILDGDPSANYPALLKDVRG